MKSLIASPYFHFAFFLDVITMPFWVGGDWFSAPIQVLPNLIGFTLGGYALMTALGSDDFKIQLSGSTNNGNSPFVVMNAAFLHFVLCQIVALILALVGQAKPFDAIYIALRLLFEDQLGILVAQRRLSNFFFAGFSFFVFLYAILAGMAATIGIFRVSRWYDVWARARREQGAKLAGVNDGEPRGRRSEAAAPSRDDQA
jgi:hypothetical protein